MLTLSGAGSRAHIVLGHTSSLLQPDERALVVGNQLSSSNQRWLPLMLWSESGAAGSTKTAPKRAISVPTTDSSFFFVASGGVAGNESIKSSRTDPS
jgi:hypothetical protein